MDGQVCITNTGSHDTRGLAGTIDLTAPPDTTPITTTALDVSTEQVIPAGLTRTAAWSARGTSRPTTSGPAGSRHPFLDLGPGHHETKIDKNRKARSHIRQLEALGYTVTLTQAA